MKFKDTMSLKEYISRMPNDSRVVIEYNRLIMETWICTKCKDELATFHYCINCDTNPFVRIKELKKENEELKNKKLRDKL